MPVAPPVYVEASPSLDAPQFGLMSASTLVQWDDPHLHNGVEFTPNASGLAGFEATDCVDEPADPRDIPDGIPTAIASPIIVYGGFTCRSVGITDALLDGYARARLSAGEVAGVESRLWSAVDNSLTDGAHILSTTAVSLTAAVGLIEEWFGARYGGTPVIHAPRRLGALAGQKVLAIRDKSKMVTTLGSTWSFGNYPGTAPAGQTGPLWLVASGQVQVRRSDVTVLGSTMQTALNRRTNSVYAVAHRTYVASWDGISAAVPVTAE